ncbi:MAG: hypothetical protein JWN81_632 [Solirubrobacterales bacterium]|jgi:hypothetical protein|nr:hypothetical protein [Solirubrobacterales bacterium]
MRERSGQLVRLVVAVVVLSTAAPTAVAPMSADAAVVSSAPAGVPRTAEQQSGGSSLESAAAKAGNTGRAVAMSLIGLAFAVAGTVLAFRRDFKEAAGVFAVGIISVLLATTAGVSLLRDTVTSLFGSR